MVGGAKLGGSSGATGGLADKYSAGVEVPRQLKGPDHDVDLMLEKLPELEKKLEQGTLTSAEDIHSVRITWLFYFGAMERGGDPRCEPCKRNPKYFELKSKSKDLDVRLAKLEAAVGKCRYGYRMTNGDLLPMTLDWSEDEWNKIVEKAQPVGYMQKERCWENDVNGKAGKPGAWAF